MASTAGCWFGVTGVSLVLYVAMMGATWWFVRRRGRLPLLAAHKLPPVSVIKPIKGEEESLRDNLLSLYAQAYAGGFEVVFASTDRLDPGIQCARRVAALFPHIPSRFVWADEAFGLNPKVANIAAALPLAKHDMLFQSDANVRLQPDYLHRMVSEFQQTGAHLLSSLVVGVDESSPGAAMENLHLSASIAPAMCAALVFAGVPCVIGKALLVRRSELEELQALHAMRDVLAEDYVLGRLMVQNGRKVVLSSISVHNVNQRIGLRRFLARHSRWLKMRAVINRPSFVADLALNPSIFALLAAAQSGWSKAGILCWTGVMLFKVAGDALLMQWTRGDSLALRHWLLSPCKDLLMVGVWAHACVSRTVEWRGVQYTFGPQSRLLRRHQPLPAPSARPKSVAVRSQ